MLELRIYQHDNKKMSNPSITFYGSRAAEAYGYDAIHVHAHEPLPQPAELFGRVLERSPPRRLRNAKANLEFFIENGSDSGLSQRRIYLRPGQIPPAIIGGDDFNTADAISVVSGW